MGVLGRLGAQKEKEGEEQLPLTPSIRLKPWEDRAISSVPRRPQSFSSPWAPGTHKESPLGQSSGSG